MSGQARSALSGLMEVSNDRARAAGLRLTNVEVAIADTRAWLAERKLVLALTPERERELIARARRRGQDSDDAPA